MESDRYKARDVQPTVLRLHPELRAELVRIAFVNGRSLSKEIAVRLQTSLAADQSPPQPPLPNPYTAPNTPAALPTNDNGPAGALSDTDQAILEVFRALSVEKRLALLALLR